MPHRIWIVCSALVCSALLLITGCELGDRISDSLPDLGSIPVGPEGVLFDGQQLGEVCDESNACRRGLECLNGLCEAPGTSEEGTICAVSDECAEGLVCDSLQATCQPADGGVAGDSCLNSTDCSKGYRCVINGFSGVCTADSGTVDIGGACDSDASCVAPLLCGKGGHCRLPSFGGAFPLEGAECPRGQQGEGEFRVLFDVPKGQPLSEFFALPYPNDIRQKPEGINLAGFYNPGTDVFGGEFFDAFISRAGEGWQGFSPSSTVYLRFSHPFHTGQVTGGGDNPTLFYRNITPESSEYNHAPQSWSWKLSTGRGNFICYNSVQVRADWGRPRTEGETYAVWITTDVTANPDGEQAGTTVAQSDSFQAMLAGNAPASPALQDAWEAYAPFRQYLSEQQIDPGTIAGAAVFTVGTPSQGINPLKAAVDAATPSSLKNLTVCDGSHSSPCSGGETRGCLNEDTGYIELHGTYEAPVYQQGKRPYLTPEDGGNIVVNNSGVAETQGTEEICFSMAIPANASMPEGGWPVVMYAHGTGGDFTSHLRPAIAGRLTDASVGDTSAHFVTIGIDGMMHGPRRGGSDLAPDTLFFNPENPVASRANVLQGAADYLYLTKVLNQVDIAADESPTGERMSFDANARYFYGHSQGATVGTLYAAADPDLQGAVLSGAGGGFVLSILNKTSPQDVASVIPLLLGENDVSDTHPFLNLIQHWIDPADAINYGRLIPPQSPEDNMGAEVFQVYGIGDTYTPPEAMLALAISSRLGAITPVIDPVRLMQVLDKPVSGNLYGSTAVMHQYEPTGNYNGHFVSTRNPTAVEDIEQFFVTSYVNGTATIN